ncbi:MAG: ParB/RepB/Spo0J family partition protein [Oscillospiraceae bacterium]|jgi:ParB family chromosome partitioning protein
MAERGLGRGLGALLGEAALQPQEEGSMQLPIAQIEVRPDQPRKYFDESALSDLADSIRLHGVLQPITVRKLPSGYYQIIAGERRWRAARMAGLEKVPAMVVEADEQTTMELALIENLQREDLNPVEEAGGYQLLMEAHGLTQEEVALRVGKSRPAVANALRLLALPDSVLHRLKEGILSGGHARALLALKDPALQEAAAEQVVSGKLSVRQTEALVKRLLKAQQTPAEPEAPRDEVDYIQQLEQTLTERLARRVHIRHGKKKGRLEVEYYGEEDLEALLELLGTKGGHSI